MGGYQSAVGLGTTHLRSGHRSEFKNLHILHLNPNQLARSQAPPGRRPAQPIMIRRRKCDRRFAQQTCSSQNKAFADRRAIRSTKRGVFLQLLFRMCHSNYNNCGENIGTAFVAVLSSETADKTFYSKLALRQTELRK